MSTGGAMYPAWTASGRILMYESLAQDQVLAADYTSTADSFSASKPRVWASLPMIDPSGDPNIDVSPDGKRVAVFPRLGGPDEQKGSLHVTFLLNFFDE